MANGSEPQYSVACRRAGLTSLLFSAFGFSLLPLLTDARALDALNQYVSLRRSLSIAVQSLNQEPCWKVLLATKQGNEWPLAKLSEYTCEAPAVSEHSPPGKLINEPKAEGTERSRSQSKLVITLGIGYSLWEARSILDALTKLEDETMLSWAGKLDHNIAQSIRRWEDLLVGIISKRRAPDITFLTIDDVEQLASYEILELPSRTVTGEETRIAVSPTGLSLGVVPAAIFTGAVLLVSLAYFWLFQREGSLLEPSPSPGTLFGAFYRDRISRLIFLILAFVPTAAAGCLAWRSFYSTYWTTGVALLVLLLSILIGYTSFGTFRRSVSLATKPAELDSHAG